MKRNSREYQEFVERQTELSNLATINGCCGIFDMCSNQDVISLSMEGSAPLLDWIGWQASDECVIRREFISFVRPEQEGGECTDGWVAPCDDPDGIEWGKCDFALEDFGSIGREGPTRDVTKATDLRYCERQPRWRIDGTEITDDLEYDLRVVAEVISQDVKRAVIDGNVTQPNEFDGLRRLVKTGYTNASGGQCQLMDSNIVDWNGNTMAGGAGITWNGTAQPLGYDLVDYLLEIFMRIKTRIMWAPAFSSQTMSVGDVVIVLPAMHARCLLDFFTCWTVCPTETTGPNIKTAFLEKENGNQFRLNLNGGMFQAGRIFLDGFEIPLIVYDWGSIIRGPTRGDIYMLWRGIGNVRALNGQYNDVRAAADSDESLFWTDGGRFLGRRDSTNKCQVQKLWFHPRILMWAPWMQTRIEDVVCDRPGGHLSPDPCETSYFPLESFSVAECPT